MSRTPVVIRRLESYSATVRHETRTSLQLQRNLNVERKRARARMAAAEHAHAVPNACDAEIVGILALSYAARLRRLMRDPLGALCMFPATAVVSGG
jgi:hypothetical protein